MRPQEIAVFGPALLIWCLALYAVHDPHVEGDRTDTYMLGRAEHLGASFSLLASTALSLRYREATWMVPLVPAVLAMFFGNQFRRSIRSADKGSGEWRLLLETLLASTTLGAAYMFTVSFSSSTAAPDVWTGKVCLLFASLFFLGVGGTYIVRAVLSVAGYDPTLRADMFEPGEHRAGKAIGVLERVLATSLVITGRYEAIAVLLAIKTLRTNSREIRKKNFGDYMLLGSLASLGLAMLVGELLRRGLAVGP